MTITIDDFKKIDLRVGTIINVSDHPDADKLYVLTVDFGAEERTLVAGLKKYYSPDQLPGMQVVAVTNLEPAVVRGVTSNGMLLAAQSGEIVSLLSPEKPIVNGAKVF
jgi:methionyl-tRNA synthetase